MTDDDKHKKPAATAPQPAHTAPARHQPGHVEHYDEPETHREPPKKRDGQPQPRAGEPPTLGRPTPTQEENDRAAMGEHITEHEDDGSGPDPHAAPTKTRQVEAAPGGTPYKTR